MRRRGIFLGAVAAVLLLALAAPVAAAPPAACSLQLDVAPTSEYGEPVVLRVTGLTGVGGLDIFTQWRNRTEEEHLFLMPGVTEIEYVFRAYSPEPLPPLEPGHYTVHAEAAFGCEAHTSFRVTR